LYVFYLLYVNRITVIGRSALYVSRYYGLLLLVLAPASTKPAGENITLQWSEWLLLVVRSAPGGDHITLLYRILKSVGIVRWFQVVPIEMRLPMSSMTPMACWFQEPAVSTAIGVKMWVVVRSLSLLHCYGWPCLGWSVSVCLSVRHTRWSLENDWSSNHGNFHHTVAPSL